MQEIESFRYSEEEKQAFVIAYHETGKYTDACKQTGVNYETAKAWGRAEWFETALAKVRAAADRALDRQLSRIIEKSQLALLDRIENGEERITKSGEVVKVQVGAAALTMAMGVSVDKRNIIRSGGTATTEASALDKLAEALKALAPKPIIIEAATVEYRDNS